jgi:flavin-dependent dehydrogenase
VLLVGDACGYVEPFSGEGMKWAVLSAAALATLLGMQTRWQPDLPQRWMSLHQQLLAEDVARCRHIARLPHHPLLLSGVLYLLPAAARMLVRKIHRPVPRSAYCTVGEPA